jgi:hypothetical protein
MMDNLVMATNSVAWADAGTQSGCADDAPYETGSSSLFSYSSTTLQPED